jgi:glutaconate CoA-transferase subunit B
VRLPGGGGAPEIAAMAGEVIVIIRQSTRTFVERLDFRSSIGFGDGTGDRERLGLPGRGPTIVITDLGVLRPDPETCELTLTQVHPDVSVDQVREATGWPLRVADHVDETEPPTDEELRVLRQLRATLEAVA